MATVCIYSFEAKIASRSYQVYKETSWSKTQYGEDVKVELEASQNSERTELVPFVQRRNISKDRKQ